MSYLARGHANRGGGTHVVGRLPAGSLSLSSFPSSRLSCVRFALTRSFQLLTSPLLGEFLSPTSSLPVGIFQRNGERSHRSGNAISFGKRKGFLTRLINKWVEDCSLIYIQSSRLLENFIGRDEISKSRVTS